jgi:putative Mn2+ efflux pump MntP
VSFGLLAFIGGKMIFEAVRGDTEEESGKEYKLDLKELTLLAIATSIDALAVGIVFAAEKTNLIFSVTMIGVITFALSLLGVYIGHRFGSKYEKGAEIAGGAVLILIGVKLLLGGLGVL